MDIMLNPIEAAQLREYFADNYIESDLHHNYTNDKKNYSYPQVQYKIIENNPMVLGIDQGARELLHTVLFEEYLTIGQRQYRCSINSKKYEPKILDTMRMYKFLSPWLALGRKNYDLYITMCKTERKELLERILIDNILAFCNGINSQIKNHIKVNLVVENVNVSFNGKQMIGFNGAFSSNILLPDYIGIGEHIIKGFGTIMDID